MSVPTDFQTSPSASSSSSPSCTPSLISSTSSTSLPFHRIRGGGGGGGRGVVAEEQRNRGRENAGSCSCCAACTKHWRAGREDRSEGGQRRKSRGSSPSDRHRARSDTDGRETRRDTNENHLIKRKREKEKKMDSTAVTAKDNEPTGLLTDTQLSVATGLVLMFGMFWVIGYLLNFLNFAPLRRRRYYPGHEDPHAQASSMSFLEKALNTVSRWTSLDSF
ncbi:uncharacterized protein LOC119597541 [Penaeus monodon]|uniref:uncharacterized protein LOC119597541 n=1 Tax=Penaeus monodon TaxID=6687 RepID=UPI0018A79AB0|nr:uncharacterized protein LOC119597541 [Penaeus monodon]